jgi:hypothetical protein
MVDVEVRRFTVGVFQNAAWAQKGLEALARAGLPAESLSIIGKESPELSSLIEQHLGGSAERMDLSASARRWRAGRS